VSESNTLVESREWRRNEFRAIERWKTKKVAKLETPLSEFR